MALVPNQVIRGRYQILAQLGQGGFGVVYRALDLHLNRLCAVKENLDASPGAQQQFRTEAQLLARLRHENLPQVIDYFIEPNGLQYLVMEFIAGDDLQTLLTRVGPLSESRVLEWAFQILAALEYLHTQVPPIIHRDIKPANIRIAPDGHACLVDFGIAKAAIFGAPTITTARGVTPGYSPPEQYSGGTDARSDIYALGATLYFAVTGVAPADAMARVGNQIHVPEPGTFVSTLSRSLNSCIMRALDLRADLRFSSAREMKDALRGRLVTTQTVATVQPYAGVTPTTRPLSLFWVLSAFAGGISAALVTIWFLLPHDLLTGLSPPPATAIAVAPSATFFPTHTLVPTRQETGIRTTPTRQPPAPSRAPTQEPTQPSATPIPTSTRAPSSTPPPTSTPIPSPQIVFKEEFSQTNPVNTNWNVTANAGSVRVSGDALALSSRGDSYPFLTTRANPFPINGDFRATFRFAYPKTATCGVGIVMTSYALPGGMSSARAASFQENSERNGMAAGVFDYADGLHVIYRAGNDRRDFRYPKPDRFQHQLDFMYQAGRYSIDFDGAQIYRSAPTTARANFIWMGHPAVLDNGAACEWDSLEIDFIQIEQL